MSNSSTRVYQRFLASLTPERVMTRFRTATRPLKPEMLEKLLLKLRKGAGSMPIKDFVRILDALGGWEFRPHPVASKKINGYKDTGEPYKLRAESEEALKAILAKWHKVNHWPKPEEVKEGETYYMDPSSPFQEDKWVAITCQAWEGEDGTRITAPNGKRFYVDQPLSQVERSFVTNLRGYEENGTQRIPFWDFLNGASGFIADVNKRLQMPSYEQEKIDRKVKPRTRGNTGTCPCCFRNIKLIPKALEGKERDLPGMTLHGFVRPGVGYNQGQCFGQHWPPFELSSAGSVAYRAYLEKSLDESKGYLARLKSGSVTSFTEYNPRTHARIEHKLGDPEFETQLKNRIHVEEITIRQLERDIQALTRAITAWKLKPLPEEGEEHVDPSV